MNVPQVCLQDGNFEHDEVEKDKPDPLSKRKMEESIEYIKTLLSSIDDGQMSVSPYDTTWVALIKDFRGHNNPQFPSTLEWIATSLILQESESEDELLDDVEEELDHENEVEEQPEPMVMKPVDCPAPKETERQLSKKERKKKELAELEAILADFGLNPKEKPENEP